MILVGSQRAGAAALADHLMNTRDNDHVTVLELDGFAGGDLHEALQEVQAIASVTRCKQYLYSLSLNPPPDHSLGEKDFIDAADKAGATLGLSGQPRAIIIHEKEGRRHAHAVWSRIDTDTLKAVNLSHDKVRLRDLSRDLFLDHGWTLPRGLQTYGGGNPLNFTLAEWQQAKRQGMDARELKQVFREAWAQSDTLNGLRHGLEERGLYLAKGDRRGLVAVDIHGEVYALARWTGIKTKEVRNRCGSGDDLEPVSQVKDAMRRQRTGQMLAYIEQFKAKHAADMAPLMEERERMAEHHARERDHLAKKQAAREAKETKARLDRLNSGLRGLFDRLTGHHRRVRDRNLKEALACLKRDRGQRETLVLAQMQDRQALQRTIATKRRRQAEERRIMARDVAAYLRRSFASERSPERSHRQTRERGLHLEL
ncbi:relaxase [Rhodobacteraceae bacterium CCMM004]|nr:relaxase [Rhodobacteraceae bacterium CCMM004]